MYSQLRTLALIIRPDLNNLRYTLDKLSAFKTDEILIVAASLSCDILPARKLGAASVWIERPGTFGRNNGDGIQEERSEKIKLADWTFESTVDEFAKAMAIAKGS